MGVDKFRRRVEDAGNIDVVLIRTFQTYKYGISVQEISERRKEPILLHLLTASGKSGTVSGLVVVGVCLPLVSSLTRSLM